MTTAFTHLAAIIPILRWGYVIAAVAGLGWLMFIAASYWSAYHRHPIAWFEHGGDLLDLIGPTAALAVAVGAGLLVGAPIEQMRLS